MPKFFNATRGPVSATVGDTVLMFPAKAWTSVPDDLGVSPSVQNLLVQKVLVAAPDAADLKVATASKPSKAARAAEAAKQAAAKPAPVKASAKADALKDTAPKIETQEPAPAPVKV